MTGNPEEFFAWLVVVPLWGAALWRLPMAIRRPKSRVLWSVFTLLAISMTTRIQAVGDALFELTGTPDVATLVKHLVGIGAIANLLRWVTNVVPEREDGLPEPRYRRVINSRPRKIITWVVVILITAVFPFANLRHNPAEDAVFIFAQAGHLWGSVHLLLFYTYLMFGMICASMMCAEASRRDSGMFGHGLRMMAIGCAVGTMYGGLRSAYLLTRLANKEFIGGDAMVDTGSNLFLICCVLLVLGGSLVPPLQRLETIVDKRAAISALRPMWQTITRPTPGVILTRDNPPGHFLRHVTGRMPKGSHLSKAWLSAAGEWLDWRDVDYRLHRRYTEILDGALALQQYVPEGLRERAQGVADEMGLPDGAVQAYLLRVAISRKKAGAEQGNTQARTAILKAGDCTPSTLLALQQVRKALESRTMMAKMQRRLNAGDEHQSAPASRSQGRSATKGQTAP